MGSVQLTINSNLEEVIAKINQLDKNVENLNRDIAESGKVSKQSYDTATREADQFNQAQVRNQQTASKSMQMFAKFGGLIAGAFSVAAIVQFGKAVVNSTEAGRDAMERFREGVDQSFGFLKRSIADLDFTNLIQGFRDAFEEGKRYADVLDEIEDRQRSLGIQTLSIEGEIIDLKRIARDRSRDLAEREAAIEKIVALEKKKLDITKSLTDDALQNELQNASQILGVNEDLILALISNYDNYIDKIEQGAALKRQLESLKEVSTIFIGDVPTTIENTEKYELALKNLSDQERELLDLYRIDTFLVGEKRERIAEAAKASIQAVNNQKQSELELQRIRNGLYAELIANNEQSQKAIKETQDALDAAAKAAIEADNKIWEMFGGPETLEDFEKRWAEQEKLIKDNIAAFQVWADDNPMYSGEDAFEAQEFDRLMEEAKQKILEVEQFAEDHPFWEALGFENEEQIAAAKDYANEIFGILTSIVDAQVQASERLVDDLNSRIDEQEELVNREFELKKEGLGNNYALEQENLVKMQQARDQAIKDREKNIRIQRTLSTIEASISLITAAANIMKGFSSIPVVGVVLGILAVGAMIAAFVAAQSKVKDATQFAKGGRLKGLRHSDGGIPIPGTGIEVEGDEYVTNRRSTAKYLPLLEAINKDDRAAMKLFFDRRFINKIPGTVGMQFDIDRSQRLGEIVRELKRGKADVIYGDGFVIERVGGYTKRINLN